MDYRDIAIRALKTAVQAGLAALAIGSPKAAILAAASAALSVAHNAVQQYLTIRGADKAAAAECGACEEPFPCSACPLA